MTRQAQPFRVKHLLFFLPWVSGSQWKGWACLVMLHEKGGHIFSSHPKHCVGCELFTDKREKKHRSLLRRLFNMWPEKVPQLPRKKSRKSA